MYALRDFGEMIADRERFAAYSQAIKQAIRPGDSLLEIGCGPGLFALLACQAGARRVYAIDSEEIVHFARELAGANGFSDRMEFIQTDSRKARLPERVNIIVSDIRGTLPLFGHCIASIDDARKRLLMPGGLLIPQRDTLKAAVIEARDFYSRLVSPWLEAAPALNLSRSLAVVLNESYKVRFGNDQLLTAAQTWAVLDYSVGADTGAAADLHFSVNRAGMAHGICLWFETQLFGSIGFSSGPNAQETVYGQMFLPWLEPVSVEQGQNIFVSLRANLVGDEYVWRWETKISENTSIARHFQQCNFLDANFTPQLLRRRAADFMPALSEEGRADRWLLEAMDGATSLQRIAQSAAQRFPAIFPRWEDALRRAADLARKFSR